MEVFILALTVFLLAAFIGFEVITKVPPTLHTPLMSGANAISGISIVGAIIAAGAQQTTLAAALGVAALILATVNVVGGFLVTHRMLSMPRRCSASDCADWRPFAAPVAGTSSAPWACSWPSS